jgi:hypothetical protein
VTPSSKDVTISLGETPFAQTFQATISKDGGPPEDVTAQATWSGDNAVVAAVPSPGLVAPTGVAGIVNVKAVYQGVTASASLKVKVVGDSFVAPLDSSVKAAFDGAAPDVDAANAVVVDYPLANVVLPANIPAIQPQWSGGGDSTLFRIRLRAGDIVDLTVYGTGRDLVLPAEIWDTLRASARDVPTELVIEGVNAQKQLRTSPPQTLSITSDLIPDSAVYIWQNSTQTFRVLDIPKGTDTQLVTDSPALASGATCVGCHRISRDGKRFSYTQVGTEFRVGTLKFDATQSSFQSKAEPAPGKQGTYATFNPIEGSTTPAMLLTTPTALYPQNAAGDVTLAMVHPETLANIPSDFETLRTKLPDAIGRHALMADWSPDGASVVFVAYPGDKHFVRDLGDDVVLGSLVEAPVSYDAGSGTFAFGAPKVLVPSPDAAAGDPDSGQNNLLPTVSPDGKYVAFTRADGWWSIKTQTSLLNLSGRIAIARRSDGHVVELGGGSNGPDHVWSSTWPQWAPSFGKRYAFLAYGSERPYGHLITPANNPCGGLVQGQKQCKQLWIMAIDLEKLEQGTEDPSLPPFRVPGQALNVQAVSPQWTLPPSKD